MRREFGVVFGGSVDEFRWRLKASKDGLDSVAYFVGVKDRFRTFHDIMTRGAMV